MRRLPPNDEAGYRARLEEHCRDRLKERYGLDYTKQMRNQIIDAIERGHVPEMFRQADWSVHYKVQIQSLPVHLVYDSLRKMITTFLPLEGM